MRVCVCAGTVLVQATHCVLCDGCAWGWCGGFSRQSEAVEVLGASCSEWELRGGAG